MIAKIAAYVSSDSIATVIINGLAATYKAVKNRFAGQDLLSMDERMLADIGLTPDDVRSAYSRPVSEDPTMVLRLKAVASRAEFYQKARRDLKKTKPQRQHPDERVLDRCA